MARERKAQEPGYGFLYPKKDRTEGSNEPNVTGRVRLTADAIEAVCRGEEIEIAGWTKTAQNGVRYMNLSVKHIPSSQDALPRPELVPASVRAGGAPPQGVDDDIPF